MRVAHVITRLIIGGAQENTLLNVEDQHHLHQDEVCLITGPASGPEGSLLDRAREQQLDVRIVPPLQRNLNPLKDAQAYLAVKRQLKDYQPDVVHTHSSKAGILGRRAAWALGLPCVHTIHGAAFHFGQPAALFRAYQLAEKTADRWCQHFISVCDAMTQQYLRAGIGHPDKFTTIYSGMNVDRFLTPSESRESVRSRLGIGEDDVVVVKVARLFDLKGHEFLIDAAPQIITVRSTPAGTGSDGPLRLRRAGATRRSHQLHPRGRHRRPHECLGRTGTSAATGTDRRQTGGQL